jgi:hypothetical protein
MADTEFVHAISAGIGGECATSPKPCSAVSLQIEQPLIQNDANADRVVESPHTQETIETHGWEIDMPMFAGTTLAVVTLVFAANTHADAAAWCAYYDQSSGTNCGFHTIQQCQAAISGVGGYCAPNPEGPDHPATGTRRNAR